MRYFFFVCFLSLYSFSLAQESVHVKEKEYEGYIFQKEHFVFKSVENQKERYTPSLDDIKLVESILKNGINAEMERLAPYPSLHNGGRISNWNMVKYRRQYVGYLTNDGDIIIWINLLDDLSVSEKELGTEIIQVKDGGARYWNICVNITKRKLFDMYINGVT